MGNKLVPRTAKVLSETKKIKDKEAVALAYEHIPRNPAEQLHGSIYAVIELEDKSGHAEEIAERIIDLLYEHYYEDTDKEPLASFEYALAKINEELTKRSSEGQIEWFGKLNAVLAVLAGSALHITQAGKAEAYLYRADNTVHITDELAGDTINPQRTFENIASGDLTEKDRLAIVTPGVFYKVSKSELKRYATEKSPRSAAEDLSKLLAGDNGTTKPNAILLLEIVPPESIAAGDPVDEGGEIWVDDKGNTGEKIGEGVVGGTIKVFDYLGKAYHGVSVFVVHKAVPALKSGYKKIKGGYNNFHKEETTESVLITSEEKISDLEPSNLEVDHSESVLESSKPLPEKTIRIKETRNRPKLLSLERFDFGALDRAKAGLAHRKLRLGLPKGKLSYIYLGVAAALIIGVALLIYFRSPNASKVGEDETLKNKFEQAQTLYDESQQEISSGDYRGANEDLTAAERLISEVINGNYQRSESEALLAKIKSAKDQASKTTRNTATIVYEFSKQVTQIFTDGKLIYGLDFENGALYSYDPLATTSTTIAETNDFGGGKVTYATLVTASKAIACFTDNEKIYKISLTTGKATVQTVLGTLETADALDHFGTNIYALSKDDNQIYRRFSNASGYGAKDNYFKEAPDLGDVVDIAIDGSLYTVTASGRVNKYTSGVQDDYQITGLPLDYGDIRGIYTSPDTDGIYLFSAGNLIRIDQNGKFVAQFAQDEASNIVSVFTNDEQNIVYFLSGNKVYSLSI